LGSAPPPLWVLLRLVAVAVPVPACRATSVRLPRWCVVTRFVGRACPVQQAGCAWSFVIFLPGLSSFSRATLAFENARASAERAAGCRTPAPWFSFVRHSWFMSALRHQNAAACAADGNVPAAQLLGALRRRLLPGSWLATNSRAAPALRSARVYLLRRCAFNASLFAWLIASFTCQRQRRTRSMVHLLSHLDGYRTFADGSSYRVNAGGKLAGLAVETCVATFLSP